jgi:glycosyltransferase involved in cell wall biosynthesis
MLNKAGLKNHYIPHGIEPDVFCVDPDPGKIAKFKASGIFGEDCQHLTVMVAANKGYPDRKAFQVQIRAWAEFAKDKPGAKLYLHTEPLPMYGGLDLPQLCANLGVAERVVFPDRYQNFLGMPAEYLALVYNAADVFMGNSMSEGFGLPIIEAQAAGCPVVVTDFSAMPELVRWGYKVPPADKFWTPMNAWQAWPDVIGIRDSLEELYAQWHSNGDQWPRSERLRTSALIHKEFAWDSIVRDQWAPLMARLANEAPPLDTLEVEQPLARVPKAHTNGRKPEAVMPGGLHKLPVTPAEVEA